MTDVPRYPGYDVLAKWNTPSWDAKTREVIDARLCTPLTPNFLTSAEWTTADALCQRILPQSHDAMPVVALLDDKLCKNCGDGFREADMPYMREAWRKGLAAINAESTARHGRDFALLTQSEQNELLAAMQVGKIDGPHWAGLNAKAFFERRILADIPALYYSLPSAWNEIGFGGPASPRGYVRLDGDQPDPWEAREANPDNAGSAERKNKHVV